MNLNELQITNGFVGSIGKRYSIPTEKEFKNIIVRAMEFNEKTKEEIINMIESGQAVKWCESPNYYYDHSYGTIQKKQSQPEIEMVKCDCGHSVPMRTRMNASIGTSCPDCYDRMSY